TATTEIYTLSLPDALPISWLVALGDGPAVRPPGDLGQRDALVGDTTGAEPLGRDLDVVERDLQRLGRDPLRLVADLIDGDPHRATAHRRAPAPEGADAGLRHRGVAVEHHHVVDADPQLVAHDLGHRRLR